jgi:hypothetical protein
MSSTISLHTRRTLLTAFRYACPDSPASCAQTLTAYAIAQGLIAERKPVPGETVRTWAVNGKPPLWAAIAAARWLREQQYRGRSEAEIAALAAVANFHM